MRDATRSHQSSPAPGPAVARVPVTGAQGHVPPTLGAMLGLQRMAGNRSAALLVRRWSAVQRVPGDGATGDGATDDTGPGSEREPGEAAEARAAEARASATLANERFTGIDRLGDLVRGGAPLSRRDDGAPVRAVQQGLLDIGYALLRFQHDGHWGAETEQAIALFRADRTLEREGGMDAEAMEELDGAAPPPGAATQHSVDYDRLFADGRLDVAIAIGYDENGGHTRKIEQAHTFLGDRGFTRSDAEGATDPVEHWGVTQSLTYPTGSGDRATRDITVAVQLITPGTGAAARFGEALNDAELTLYTGHARRGIGPDFDPDRSAAENFVIGVNSALHAAGRAAEPSAVERHHYVVDKVNDLEQLASETDPETGQPRFDPERYRVWFFNACTTLAYADELRGGLLPEAADRRNLDLFGTRMPVPTAAGLATTFAVLDGVMHAQSMEEIVTTMGRLSEEAAAANGFSRREAARLREAYWREGAADNPEMAAPSPAVAP